jgi:TonB family protein
VLKSFLGMLIVIILFFSFYFIWNYVQQQKINYIIDAGTVKNISVEIQEMSNYTLEKSIKTETLKLPKIVEKIAPKMEDSILIDDKKNDGLDSTAGQSGNTTKQGEGEGVNLDKYPEFPGGYNRMIDYIRIQTVYPEEARQKGIQGIVTVSVIINAIGELKSASISKSVHPILDAEALRVIGLMPEWTPGYQNGKPVDGVLVKINISFKL